MATVSRTRGQPKAAIQIHVKRTHSCVAEERAVDIRLSPSTLDLEVQDSKTAKKTPEPHELPTENDPPRKGVQLETVANA